MKKTQDGLPQIMSEITNSKPNKLAKMLYRNNSLKKLNSTTEFSYLKSVNPDSSILGSLTKSNSSKTLLIPSISLKRNRDLEVSQKSMQISNGKVFLSKFDEPSFLKQRNPFKVQKANTIKKALFKRLDKQDSINQKNMIPDELLSSYNNSNSDNQTSTIAQTRMKSSPFNKSNSPSHSVTLKSQKSQKKEHSLTTQMDQNENLTPNDFIQLIQEDGTITNQFCYLKKMNHPYDLKIVEFQGKVSNLPTPSATMQTSMMPVEEEYITISSRGVTYFSKDNSRFVPLSRWKKEAYFFSKLMNLQFFSKYRLFKNFAKWKKYIRKTAMKSTTDKLKNQLLINDKFLRRALLGTRDKCFVMENQINYCKFDDCQNVMQFGKFKSSQDSFIQNEFEKRIGNIQEDIKKGLIIHMSDSMRQFKEENKISSTNQGKGIPLLIGDEKNLQMPYTKEATLRIQQQKFKKFLKLVEFIVIDSKVKMMNESTQNTVSKVEQENLNYQKQVLQTNYKLHFKGKQYLECFVSLNSDLDCLSLKPTKEQINYLFEDIVNKSIIKLCRNHKRIINDDDILEIIYDSNDKIVKQPETNILKAIIMSDDRQEKIVNMINYSINRSYSFIEKYSRKFSFLIQIYFENLRKLQEIEEYTAKDHQIIKTCLQNWRTQLIDINALSQEHEAAMFLLNFRQFKQKAIKCVTECLDKMKKVIPEIFKDTTESLLLELQESLRKIETKPIGIEPFIEFQNNKNEITNYLDDYAQKLAQINCIWIITKGYASNSEMSNVSRQQRQINRLQTILNSLRTKIQQAQMNTKVFETRAQDQVKEMIPKIKENIYKLYTKIKSAKYDVHSNIEEVMTAIQCDEEQFQNILQEIQKIKGYQKFLSMEEYNDDTINTFSNYFFNYKNIWSFRQNIMSYQKQILDQLWIAVDIEQAKKEVETFFNKALKLKKKITNQTSEDEEFKIQLNDIDVLSFVFVEAKNMKPLVETIECLRDKSLGDKQFRQIKNYFQKIDKPQICALIDSENKTAIVRDILTYKINDQLDFLQSVVFKSKKQMQIQNKMIMVNKFWIENTASNAGRSLSENFQKTYWDIITEIDDKITVINGISQDGEGQGQELKQNITHNKTMFDTLKVLITEWEIHQRYLHYFQPIFGNSYWKATKQMKIYSSAENNWKKLLKQCKDYSLKRWASNQKAILTIRQNISLFEELKKAVEDFLTAKRQVFPKFYFLSNQELLHILLEEKDFRSVQKHLNKAFGSLKSLDIREQNSVPVGVESFSGQYLPIRFARANNFEIQDMFKTLEEGIKQSIKSNLRTCLSTFQKDEFNRKQWTKQNILQVLLFIQKSQYTKIIQYDYLGPDGEDLSQYVIYQNTQIKQLQTYLKEQRGTPGLQQKKLQTLIMQELQHREITEKLLKERVSQQQSYQWQKQVRSYYSIDMALTKYFVNEIDYGYEFVDMQNSYQRMMLSERQSIELSNALALRFSPIIKGQSDLLTHFSKFNGKHFNRVIGQKSMAEKYLLNVCMGTYLSGSYIQFQQAQCLTFGQISLMLNFIKEVNSALIRKQKMMPIGMKKNLINPYSGIVFRVSPQSKAQAFTKNFCRQWRFFEFKRLSVSGYVNLILETYKRAANNLGLKIDKISEAINQFEGYEILNYEVIRQIFCEIDFASVDEIQPFICKKMIQIVSKKVIHSKKIKFYQKIITETISNQKNNEQNLYEYKATSSKNSMQKSDFKFIINNLVEITEKKSLCIVAGPTQSGKISTISQAYRQKICRGFQIQILNTDVINFSALFGCYDNGLWKEGILVKKIKQLALFKEQWIVFEGSWNKNLTRVLNKLHCSQMQLANGQLVSMSPQWKFIFSVYDYDQSQQYPKQIEVVTSNKFISNEESMYILLEKRIKNYFETNSENFNQLSNMCINNFEKVMGLLKLIGFKNEFTKPENILRYFLNILQSVLSDLPSETLNHKDFSKCLEKIFLWSLYWSVGSGVPTVNSNKFQKCLFELVKTDIQRSQNISFLRLDFEFPQGSFKKIKNTQTIQVNGQLYLADIDLKSKGTFCQLMIKNHHPVMLIGKSGSGKSKFFEYLTYSLDQEKYTSLTVNFRRNMTHKQFKNLIYRKTRLSIKSPKKKCLCSSTVKKLVIMIDDFNLIDVNSEVGQFISSCIKNGFYYDFQNHEKIYLHNISFVVAENDTYESKLDNRMLKYFKPIYVNEVDLKDIAQIYKFTMTNVQFSRQSFDSCVSLHNFVVNIQSNKQFSCQQIVSQKSALKIMKAIKNYKGKQNLAKIWGYLSEKEYINSGRVRNCQQKVSNQINNLLNLIIQNNNESVKPVDYIQDLLNDILEKYSVIATDSHYKTYYQYVSFLISLNCRSQNILSIGQPLPETIKHQVVKYLAEIHSYKFLYAKSMHDLRENQERKIIVYLSSNDQNKFYEMIGYISNNSQYQDTKYIADCSDKHVFSKIIQNIPSVTSYFHIISKESRPIVTINQQNQSESKIDNSDDSSNIIVNEIYKQWLNKLQQSYPQETNQRVIVDLQSNIIGNQIMVDKIIVSKNKKIDIFIDKCQEIKKMMQCSTQKIQSLRQEIKQIHIQQENILKKKKQLSQAMVTLKNDKPVQGEESQKKGKIRKAQQGITQCETSLKVLNSKKNQKAQQISTTQNLLTLSKEVTTKLSPHLQQFKLKKADLQKVMKRIKDIVFHLTILYYSIKHSQTNKWKQFVSNSCKQSGCDLQFSIKILFDVNWKIQSDHILLWALSEQSAIIYDNNNRFVRDANKAVQKIRQYSQINTLLYDAAIEQPKFFYGKQWVQALQVPLTSVIFKDLDISLQESQLTEKTLIMMQDSCENKNQKLAEILYKQFDPVLDQQINLISQQLNRLSVQSQEEKQRIIQFVCENKKQGMNVKILNDIKRQCNIYHSTQQRLQSIYSQRNSYECEIKEKHEFILKDCEVINLYINNIQEYFSYFKFGVNELISIVYKARSHKQIKTKVNINSQKKLQPLENENELDQIQQFEERIELVQPTQDQIGCSIIEQVFKKVNMSLKASDCIWAYFVLGMHVSELKYQLSASYRNNIQTMWSKKINVQTKLASHILGEEQYQQSQKSKKKKQLEILLTQIQHVIQQKIPNVAQKLIQFANSALNLNFNNIVDSKYKNSVSQPARDMIVLSKLNQNGLKILEEKILSNYSNNWCCIFQQNADVEKMLDNNQKNTFEWFVLIDVQNINLIKQISKRDSEKICNFVYYYSSEAKYLKIKKQFTKLNEQTDKQIKLIYVEQNCHMSDVLSNTYEQCYAPYTTNKPEIQKVARIVLYKEINTFMKDQLDIFEKDQQQDNLSVWSNYFYQSRLVGSIMRNLKCIQIDHFIQICSELIFNGKRQKQKILVKQAKKIYSKKQDSQTLIGIIAQDVSIEQLTFEGSHIISETSENMSKLLSNSKSEISVNQIINAFVPNPIKKKYPQDVFYDLNWKKHSVTDVVQIDIFKNDWTEAQQKIDEILNNLPVFTGYEILLNKKQKFIYKDILKSQAKQRVENIKKIHQILKLHKKAAQSYKLKSQLTSAQLKSVQNSELLMQIEGKMIKLSIDEYIKTQVQYLDALESLYANKDTQKVIDFKYLKNSKLFLKYYLLEMNSQSKYDIYSYQIVARCFNEKDRDLHFSEQGDNCKGVSITEVKLKNIKYDANKNTIETNDKSDSKLSNVHICFMQSALCQSQEHTAYLTINGDKLVKLQVHNKLKEDNIWKQKVSMEIV